MFSSRELRDEIKICTVFFQILVSYVGGATAIIDVAWPIGYTKFLKIFKFLQFDFTSVFSSPCAVQPNHWSVLVFSTAVPLVVCGLIVSLAQIRMALQPNSERAHHLRKRAWGQVLVISYVIFPGASIAIFQSFERDTNFDNNDCYLAIDCKCALAISALFTSVLTLLLARYVWQTRFVVTTPSILCGRTESHCR